MNKGHNDIVKVRATPGLSFVHDGVRYKVIGSDHCQYVSLDDVEKAIHEEWDKCMFYKGNGKWVAKITIKALREAFKQGGDDNCPAPQAML